MIYQMPLRNFPISGGGHLKVLQTDLYKSSGFMKTDSSCFERDIRQNLFTGNV